MVSGERQIWLEAVSAKAIGASDLENRRLVLTWLLERKLCGTALGQQGCLARLRCGRFGLEREFVLALDLSLAGPTELRLLVQKFVLDPCGLIEELFLAKTARVAFSVLLGNVGLSMLLQICRRSESLSTFIALEGLFTSMDLLVPFEVRYLKVSDGMNVGPVPV